MIVKIPQIKRMLVCSICGVNCELTECEDDLIRCGECIDKLEELYEEEREK